MYLKSKDGVCLLLAPAYCPTKPACSTFSCQTCKVVLPRSILTSGTHVVMPTAGSAEKWPPSRSSPPLRADRKGDKYPSFLGPRYNDASVFSTLADGFPGDPGSSNPQWWLSWEYTFLFLNFISYIGVQSTNNVVIISGGQQRDSAIHIHVSILP